METLWRQAGHSSEGTPVMPDPDSAAVARRATAASNGVASRTDPDALVAQIERARENLAQTIDDLAERVSPSNNIRKLRERAQREAERPEVQAGAAILGLLVVGYIVVRVARRGK